ncbi:MAG: hypothetical protein FWE50_00235 [Alphaproteobacteria bacterium]|nr:hypothetical protein [Alphaproteobacteria bacterium]
MTEDSKKKIIEFAGLTYNMLFRHEYDIELEFYITNRCNLSCKSCYMNASPDCPDDQIHISDIKKIIRAFKKVPNFQDKIRISGGEASIIGARKLGNILQSVINMGTSPQLNTNMAWIQDKHKSAEMLKMLSSLKVPKVITYNYEGEIQQYMEKLAHELDITTEPAKRKKLFNQKFKQAYPEIPVLALCTSVDNLLHPAESAEWFKQMIKIISKSKKLQNNLIFGLITLTMDWFEKEILQDPEMNCSDFNQTGSRFNFKCHGQKIMGARHDFYDPKTLIDAESMKDIIYKSVNNYCYELVLHFYPDKTIGFEDFCLRSIARVPYLTEKGNMKSWNRLRQEMFSKLVEEYAERI